MLPYSAYFDTLAAIGTPDHPDWQATAAGLVVLRLINDWLDFGPGVITPHGKCCSIARQLIAQVPHPGRIKPFLQAAIAAIDKSEQANIQIITRPIADYTHTLIEQGQYSLAKDALTPLLQLAHRSHNEEAIVQLSLKLALAFRSTEDLDTAEEHYHTALHYARKTNDLRSIIWATTGYLKIIAHRGDLTRADTMSADVLIATKIAVPSMIGFALHDRAHMIALQNDTEKAIALLRDALRYNIPDREPALVDLAALLTESGQLSSGRRKSITLAISANNSTVRWQAVACLMYAAIQENDRPAFELYRSALQLAPLQPWLAVGYRLYVAEGLRRFGNTQGAEQVKQEAHAIAKRHQIHAIHVEEHSR